MNTKIPVYILALAALLTFQSCYTPASLVKLAPQKEPDKWFYGQALVRDTALGIEYEVGFDRFSNGFYAFDFHIFNRSNMPILIDPTQYSYIALNLNRLPLDTVKATNPEEEILEIEKHLSRNAARSRNQLGISLMAIGADIAGTVIVASDDRPGNDFVQRAVADGIHVGVAASGEANEFETADLNNLRDTWETATIRKTNLESNYSMHGKVFFQATPQAEWIEIYVPVDDTQLKFMFRQTQVPAKE